MASIALAGKMCFRTGRTSRRSPTERATESRPPGASVPLRADGCLRFGHSGLLARESSPSPAFPGSHPVALFRLRLLAHSCATAPASHRIPLVPVEILRALGGETHPALVGGRGHRKIETISGEREVEVVGGEARPNAAREILLALQADARLEQPREIFLLAALHQCFAVGSACVGLSK